MSSSNSSNGGSSGSRHSASGQSTGKKHHQRTISVRIQPTIGPSFALSVPPATKVTTLKESISDRMGLSPQKMTLLLHNNALDTGTLRDNGIEDGTEVRLVPAIESGVTTTNSVDPVAMMKHSMSGISDQQIDDFLNGKFPLSVAIRVGESVVVVNLHRAKVEEIEMDPPAQKRRCIRARRPSTHEDMDYLESSSSKHGSSSSSSSGSRDNLRFLNSNHSSSDFLSATDLTPASHHHHHRHHHHHHHRRSPHALECSKSHRTLGGESRDILSANRRHRTHKHTSSSPKSSHPHPLGQPDRSMLTYTRDVAGAPMETSVAISAPPPMETPSPDSIPRSANIISKDAPVLTANLTTPCSHRTNTTKQSLKEHGCMAAYSPDNTAMETSNDVPTSSHSGDHNAAQNTNTCGESSVMDTSQASSGSAVAKSISRSVQTDPEQEKAEVSQATSSLKDRDIKKAASKREVKLPESGVSMKRKAVMEAISEILKKMYANTEKGRLPGSFKGRFSSEFTCDSDMREILHSRTTMTSYGSEGDNSDKSRASDPNGTDACNGESANLSKAKLEETQQLRDKVANLKWKMQHKRAMKLAKRKGERSPCGWMEALKCDMPGGKPNTINRTGYCGLKRGFLLAD